MSVLKKFRKKISEKFNNEQIYDVPIKAPNFEVGGNLVIERFEVHNPGWACDGRPNSVGFSVNKPVQLYSIGLFGSCNNRTDPKYYVEIELYDEATGYLLTSQFGIYTCSGAGPYLVPFNYPVPIIPNKNYVITTKIKGPDSYKGIKGRQCVETKLQNGKKLKVQFFNADELKNTTAKWGQIPVLVFS